MVYSKKGISQQRKIINGHLLSHCALVIGGKLGKGTGNFKGNIKVSLNAKKVYIINDYN